MGDFGVSRHLDHVFTRTQLGTPGYMSPEMWSGQPYSLSSDIWALGCVAYELCALTQLFTGESEEEIRDKILHSYGFWLPADYSDELYSFVGDMLMPDPLQRKTATELLDSRSVQRRLALLPDEVRARSLPARASAPHRVLPPVELPSALPDLNLVLPPARYETGGESMARVLSRGREAAARRIATGERVVLPGLDEDPYKNRRPDGGNECFHTDLTKNGRPIEDLPDRLKMLSVTAGEGGPLDHRGVAGINRSSISVATISRNLPHHERLTYGLVLSPKPTLPGHERGAAVQRSSVSVATLDNSRTVASDLTGLRDARAPRDADLLTKQRFANHFAKSVTAGNRSVPSSGEALVVKPFEFCPVSRPSFVVPPHSGDLFSAKNAAPPELKHPTLEHAASAPTFKVANASAPARPPSTPTGRATPDVAEPHHLTSSASSSSVRSTKKGVKAFWKKLQKGF